MNLAKLISRYADEQFSKFTPSTQKTVRKSFDLGMGFAGHTSEFPEEALQKLSFLKRSADPLAMSSDEFANSLFGRHASIVKTDSGKIISGWDHGQALENAGDIGETLSEPLGQRAGWKFGNRVVFSKDILDFTPASLYIQMVKDALTKGESVPPEAISEARRLMGIPK